MAVMNRFSALEDLDGWDDPVPVPTAPAPAAVQSVSHTSSPTTEKKTQVFVDHIESEAHWNNVLTQAANIGKIKSSSHLVRSKAGSCYFGFITMSTHEDARHLIEEIGKTKWEMDYIYEWNTMQCIYVRKLYADWAVVDNRKKITPKKKK